jgi:hypothetical protein
LSDQIDPSTTALARQTLAVWMNEREDAEDRIDADAA